MKVDEMKPKFDQKDIDLRDVEHYEAMRGAHMKQVGIGRRLFNRPLATSHSLRLF